MAAEVCIPAVDPGRPGGLSPRPQNCPRGAKAACLQQRCTVKSCRDRKEKKRKEKESANTREKKNASLTLWLSPLFLILLASLPVARINRDTSSSSTEPGMVPIPSSKLSRCLTPLLPSRYPPSLRLRKKIKNLRPLARPPPPPPPPPPPKPV